MVRPRDILKTMVRINCFILIATTNVSLAVGIAYLVGEGSAVLYFEKNKHFNDRPTAGISWLMLKIFLILITISIGFQLAAMSFLTIWKKCDDCRRTRVMGRLYRAQETIDAAFGIIYERNPAYTVSLV